MYGPFNFKEASSENAMYREVDFANIPNGCANVPLTINDNGTEYLTQMVAGSFGIEAFGQQKLTDSLIGNSTDGEKSRAMTTADNGKAVTKGVDGCLDSIKPLTGWMMYHTNNFEDGHIKNLQPVSDGSINRVDRLL